jgi:hypothetical protein
MNPLARQSRRLFVVKNATDIVVRRLTELPPSPEVLELQTKAEACRREVEAWALAPPSAEASDKFMERLFMLHIAVGKLERLRTGT